MKEITPEDLLPLYNPQLLTKETREQIEDVLASPQFQQYFIEHAFHNIIQNSMDAGITANSRDFIVGLNRGVLLLLSSILDNSFITTTE